MTDRSPGDRVLLADWRRRIAELYAEVRRASGDDPAGARDRWASIREELFRSHPQSPVPAAERAAFRARHWPYDPTLRFEVRVEPAEPAEPREPGEPGAPGAPTPLPTGLAIATSGEGAFALERIGRVRLPFPDRPRTLSVYWLADYAGGLFVPFRDATNGTETYGAGRYVIDTAKGADLGGDAAAGTILVDLNFAYHPSCAFDPRWACPLAAPEDRLDLPVRAGERLA